MSLPSKSIAQPDVRAAIHPSNATRQSITQSVAARQTLFDLPVGAEALVVGVRFVIDSDAEPDPQLLHDPQELELRLMEIGFVAGEPVRIIARGYPGGEPVAVRIGSSTFALRRFEAERVLVEALSTI